MKTLLHITLALALFLLPQIAKAQNPNTAAYPSAVATDTDLLVAQNSARTTLNGAITSGATTITVTSSSVFTTPTVVTIDSEAIKICSQNNGTNVLTVCSSGRGFHGAAAAHSSGSTVVAFIDQHYTNQLAAEVKAIETAIGAALANVIQPTGSYANPTWITSLAWAKLTGVPSTFTPSAHASTHAGAGSDPITSLGAVSHTGNVTFGTDNSFDIGASGANRPRNGYFANIVRGAKVGAGTVTAPNTSIDTDGAVTIRPGTNLSLSAGVNSDIDIGSSSFLRSTASGAYSITGFNGGFGGRILLLWNASAQTLTIKHYATSALVNRIFTPSGADFVLRANANSFAAFIYDDSLNAWILMFTN